MSNTAPALDPKAQGNRTPGRSVLAADLRIHGDIHADGTIEIMGEVEGSVKAKALIVTNEGRMSGNVTAETVELRGQMQGTVGCGALTLRSAAQVTADVTYETLAIESGATVEGSFRKPKA